MLGLDRRTLHDILPPIHVGIHDRVVTESETFQCIFVESVLRLFVVIIHLIKELGVGVTVRHFQNPCGLLDADRGRNGYLGFSFLSSAGGNQDYTIGTTYPEYSCSGSVFQDGHTFYLIGVHLEKGTFHSVYQYERSRSTFCQ